MWGWFYPHLCLTLVKLIYIISFFAKINYKKWKYILNERLVLMYRSPIAKSLKVNQTWFDAQLGFIHVTLQESVCDNA